MPFLRWQDGSDAGSSGWGQLRKRRHVALIGSALIEQKSQQSTSARWPSCPLDYERAPGC